MKHGFTLLELMVVLAITVLLAGVATVRLRAPYRAARLEETVGRLAFIDYQARAHARRFLAPADIVFELDRGAAYVRTAEGARRHCAFPLPRGIRIVRVRTPHADVNTGIAQIHVSARGATPTYAVCVATAQSNRRRWMLVSGVTGCTTYPERESHVQAVLQLWQATSPDTH